MVKAFLRAMMGISMVTLFLGTPPAYAIFGIRAARKVVAARKAAKMASTSPDKAVPQVKEKTGQQAVQKVQD